MNTNRPVYRESYDERLCKYFHNGLSSDKCERSEACKFTHDVKAYLEKKPADLGEKCPIYSTRGFCMFGLTCRFSKSHLSEDNINLNYDSEQAKDKSVGRSMTNELQMTLRKKKYDFTLSNNVLDEINDSVRQARQNKKLGMCEDEEAIVVRPEERKRIDFRNKLVLAPLTTVGNLPFRRICKEYGADITVGEMACSVPLINGTFSEWALTKRHASEDVFGVQIEGNNSKVLAYASQLLKENAEVDFVDLNLGCPIDLIFKQGGGSALLRRENILEQIIKSCSKILGDTPFTVKSRMGIYQNKPIAKDLLPKFEKWGASAVTLHGRSREQRYTKSADWKYINEVAENLIEIPLIGNGDILSYEDYARIKDNYKNVSSVMLGRGPLIKPWIFKEIKEQKPFDLSSQERLEMLKKYVYYGLEHWGSDQQGVESTRKFLLEWLSFLYRYVPYGIMLHPPQRINQRPETTPFYCRDELESLMASNKSSDWIKISEMLLGKVPENFQFLPKHKANAY
jgi:tRNA-dihydrouridine synthase 3